MLVKRHFQLLSLILVAFVSYGAAMMWISHNQKAANKLSPLYFYDKLEHKADLDSFKGKIVLINLWASWCAPCIAELPSLDRLQQKMGGQDFKVVAISMDKSSLKEIAGFLQKKGIRHLDVYWDKDRQVPLKWKYQGIPTSFLLDRDGLIIRQYHGDYNWDDISAVKEIEALQEESSDIR